MFENFYSVLENFRFSPDNENMGQLCSIIKTSQINEDKIADLTKVLAESGKTLSFPDHNTADIPSTGGPSSLSTIIAPLILKKYFTVPKLGIVGRPAGGVDVLSQIEGFNLKLTEREIYKIIDKTQYCHFISNNQFTPLDSKLFTFRSENNFKDIPSLVIASLLAKKAALNVKNVCLDIRYSHFGNFGKSIEDSKNLSNVFRKVSALLGIKSCFYFSDNTKLFQPYIGRGESLLAINEYFSGNESDWLKKHIEIQCRNMVESLTNDNIETSKIKNIIKVNFQENIEIQGGSMNSFESIAQRIKSTHFYEFKANKSGCLNIDIMKMRDTIVKIQNKYRTQNNEFPDPCGIIFRKNQNENISENETILTYRVPENDLEYIKNKMNGFITIN